MSSIINTSQDTNQSFVINQINVDSLKRFLESCKNASLDSVYNRKYVLFSYYYTTSHMSIAKTDKKITCIGNTDKILHYYVNSEEFEQFAHTNFTDPTLLGDFYIYTYPQRINGKFTGLWDIILNYNYIPSKHEIPECTADRISGICKCCGTVTKYEYNYEYEDY